MSNPTSNTLTGGEFLIKDIDCNQVFIPEEFGEEQLMMKQTCVDFINRELAFGAPSTQWWVHLSSAIVFGLGFATILTLVVTPAALMAAS